MKFVMIDSMVKRRGPRQSGSTKLARFLIERDITLAEIAEILHVTPQQVSNLARGKSRACTDYLVKIAQHYHLPWDYFFEVPGASGMFTVGARVQEILEVCGVTIEELAERSGVPVDLARELLAGTRQADDLTITRICQAFGFSPSWLATGDGDRFAAPSQGLGFTVPCHGPVSPRILTPEEFQNLPACLQRDISMAIEILCSNTPQSGDLSKAIDLIYRTYIQSLASLERERELERRVAQLEKELRLISNSQESLSGFQGPGASSGRTVPGSPGENRKKS